MPGNYDAVDLWFTDEADFNLVEGDLGDTSVDLVRSIVQEVRTRVKSNKRDWRTDSFIGADLEMFIGEPNSKGLAEEIKLAIRNALIIDGLLDSGDITVLALPLDIHTILFRIIVRVATLTTQDSLSLTLVYDTLNDDIRLL